MNLDLEFIKSYLSEDEASVCKNIEICGKRHIEVRRVSFLFNGMFCPEPLTAYICLPEEVHDPVDCSLTYILIGDDDPRFAEANRLVIRDPFPKEIIHELISQMFFAVSSWKSTLIELIAEKASVTDLVLASEEIFRYNSITVTDSSCLIIGHGSNTQNESWFVNNVQQTDGKAFIKLNNEEVWSRVIPDTPFQPFFTSESKYNKNIRTLRAYVFSDSGFFMAWLTICQIGQPLCSYHKNLAAYLADCIKRLLTFSVSGLNSVTSSAIFSDLLSGNLETSVIDKVLLTTGWDMDDRFRVVIMNTKDRITQDEKLGLRLVNMLTNLAPTSVVVLYDSQAVILLHGEDTKSLRDNTWLYLEKCIHDEKLHAGVSNSSMGIQSVPALYEQARFSLSHITSDTPRISFYKDLFMDHMISVFQERYPNARFLHPWICHLDEYDKQHDSYLVETLYHYLLHNRSHIASAQALHIHKSTFLYRLTTIKSLLPIDFENAEDCLNLMLSARSLLEKENRIKHL